MIKKDERTGEKNYDKEYISYFTYNINRNINNKNN